MEKKLEPKLRFKEFSEGWKSQNLEEVSVKISDGIHSTPIYSEGTDYYFINGNNLDSKSIKIFDNTKCVSKEEYLKHKRELSSDNTILLSINGTIGNLSYYNDETVVLGKSACYINLKDNISKEFIFNKLQTHRIKNYFEGELTGSTIKNLSLKTIKNTKVLLPPLPEQEKIASFLSSVDSRIEKLEKKKELLEQYKKGSMQKIFTQEIRFKDDNGNDYPEWVEKRLGEITTLMQSGLSRKLSDKDIGVPVIRSNNLQNGRVKTHDIKYWHKIDDKGAKMENYYLKEKDLLVNFINSLSQIGKVSIYNNEFDREIIFTTNIMRLNFKENIDPKYIFNLFQAKRYADFIQSISKPAVSQASFTTVDFKMFKFKLPCLEEQEKIANFLSSIDKKIEVVTKEIERNKEFKKGLLQQMFC